MAVISPRCIDRRLPSQIFAAAASRIAFLKLPPQYRGTTAPVGDTTLTIHPPVASLTLILAHGPGVSVRELSVNRGYMGADFLGNDRRRSAPIVEPFDFFPLIRSKIAEFSAYFPGLLSPKI